MSARSDPAIASAVADVAIAADRVVAERAELVRAEATVDIVALARAVAVGAAACVLLGVGAVAAAFALVALAVPWTGHVGALILVAVVGIVTAAVLVHRARARLPKRA